MVLVRRRGHGQPGVVGEQRDHAVDVGGDVGGRRSAGRARVPLAADPGRGAARGPVRIAVAGRHASARARCSVPLTAVWLVLEQAGHLGRAGSRARRCSTSVGSPGAAAGAAAPTTKASSIASLGLVAGLGPGERYRRCLQQHVGIGLQPGDWLATAGGLAACRNGGTGTRPRTRRPAGPQRVEALVGRDAGTATCAATTAPGTRPARARRRAASLAAGPRRRSSEPSIR